MHRGYLKWRTEASTTFTPSPLEGSFTSPLSRENLRRTDRLDRLEHPCPPAVAPDCFSY